MAMREDSQRLSPQRVLCLLVDGAYLLLWLLVNLRQPQRITQRIADSLDCYECEGSYS